MKVEKDILVDFFFEFKFINLGIDIVYYVELGEGDLIILLYGLFVNVYLWWNIILNIDDNKKVIVLDFLGFGKLSFLKNRNVLVEV